VAPVPEEQNEFPTNDGCPRSLAFGDRGYRYDGGGLPTLGLPTIRGAPSFALFAKGGIAKAATHA
jgi:hypothetical protein